MVDKEKLELNMSVVLIGVVLSLVVFQALGLVFGSGLGLDVKLGPVFVILPLGLSALVGVSIVKKLITGEFITKEDLLAVVVIAMISLLSMFFLPTIVPQIFSVDISSMQSMIGFG